MPLLLAMLVVVIAILEEAAGVGSRAMTRDDYRYSVEATLDGGEGGYLMFARTREEADEIAEQFSAKMGIEWKVVEMAEKL